jgi:tetratricopeptide (TPR) repeat protein
MGLSNRLCAESPAEKMLLAKAQSLVAHGHLELAIQTWQQVLLSDPADREALLGIAKADMQLGKTEEAQKYEQQLRDLGNSSADVAQIEAMPHVQSQSVRLNDARRLAATFIPTDRRPARWPWNSTKHKLQYRGYGARRPTACAN